MPIDIDRFARVNSTIQRWDPRVKVLSLGFFILVVSLLTTIPISLLALCFAIVMLSITKLPVYFIINYTKWIVLFLVPFFFILPFTYPAGTEISIFGVPLVLEGLYLAILIFVKAITIVITTLVLFGSSRFNLIMTALNRLKCPTLLVQMLLFTYQYIFVLVEEISRMNKAMRSRGFVVKLNTNTLISLGNLLGAFLLRSFERTDRIYKAMLSRGYKGEFNSIVTFRANNSDFIKAAIVITITIALLGSDFFRLWGPIKT